MAETRTRYGYRRIYVLLRREGWSVNHKRVYRLYRAEGLAIRQKPPKHRVAAKIRRDREEAHAPNVCWPWILRTISWRSGPRFLDKAISETSAFRHATCLVLQSAK